MKVTKNKTKMMIVSRWEWESINIKVEGQKIKNVKDFKYSNSLTT